MRHAHTASTAASMQKKHPLNQQEVGICLALIGNARITQIPHENAET